MSTWWSVAPRADLGLYPGVGSSITRPFAITNRGWYVLHRFLQQAGAPSTHLMVGPEDSFVPSRMIVQWGQMLEKLAYGDWQLVSRFDGRTVVAVGIVHNDRLDTISDDLELTPLFGTPTYNWLLGIGQELISAPSGYIISGKPKKGSPMSVSLVKGQKIDMNKAAEDAGISGGLSEFFIAAGWDARTGAGAEFDLDLFTVGCDASGKRVSDDWNVFFNQLSAPNGAVVHSGDNLTGAGDGDDEKLDFDLSKVPADVAEFPIYVTIYDAKTKGNLNFGLVNNAFVRAVDKATGTEIFRFDLTEDAGPVPTVKFAKLYRDPNGNWAFKTLVEARTEEIEQIFASH